MSPSTAARQQLADGARAVQPVGAAVDETETGVDLAAAVEERLAEDLEPGAHREDRPAGVRRPAERTIGELRDSQCLRGVLATAEDVDVGVLGHRVVEPDVDRLRSDAAPAQPLREHTCVAAVAVGAEQRRDRPARFARAIRHRATTLR